MSFSLMLLAVVSLAELLLYISPFWKLRRPLAVLLLFALAISTGLFFGKHIALASGLVLVLSIYRGFNYLRIVEGRMHETYLQRTTFRTSWTLIVSQTFILGLWYGAYQLHMTGYASWQVLSVLQIVVALGMLLTTRRNIQQIKFAPSGTHLADRDLPSISVCIPARNETAALERCLNALVASDYPKLEILVLDDQSHDRTPDIIRSFAHDGVRFIKGKQPPANWLAKNWAYQRLYEEASGEILVFAGVDVRFERSSLRALITSMLTNKSQMVSLLPVNSITDDAQRAQSVLLQPARYAWELCLPRQLLRRPPVLSSCWAAQHDLMKQHGGFAAVTRAITPESYFAKAASPSTYRMLSAEGDLRIMSIKSIHDQWDTAVRTRYPQLHRRPELVLALSAGQFVGLALPFSMLIIGWLYGSWLIGVLTIITMLFESYAYALVTKQVYRQFIARSFVALPVAMLLDIAIRHYSMWRYEFGSVIWKERDVTQPVMHVTAHLPPLQ